MAPPEPIYRVVLEVHPRGTILRLVDAKRSAVIEDERFILDRSADDLPPDRVARDVFNLLYQCANDSVNDQSRGPL